MAPPVWRNSRRGTDQAQGGRGKHASRSEADQQDQDSHRDRSPRRRRSDKSTGTAPSEHAAAGTTTRQSSGSATKRDSPRPSKARSSSARGSGHQDMDVDSDTAVSAARPTSAHSRDGPSDPSGPLTSHQHKQHDFFGTQRVIRKGQQTHVVPTRLERAAILAVKRRLNPNLDIIAEAQFCFHPKKQPRYYNPGARSFCHVYNKPSGEHCTRGHYEDPDFPGVPMCGSDANEIRVHGCTWCGDVGHPASRCEGPRLSETEVQMTLVELNNWDRTPMKDWRTARNLEIFVERSRDPDGRFRKT